MRKLRYLVRQVIYKIKCFFRAIKYAYKAMKWEWKYEKVLNIFSSIFIIILYKK